VCAKLSYITLRTDVSLLKQNHIDTIGVIMNRVGREIMKYYIRRDSLIGYKLTRLGLIKYL